MHIWMLLFIFILFFILTPGVILRLPPNGSTVTVALVHALVFTIVLHFTHKMVWERLYPMG